jgi:hypothetical protein
MKHENLSQRKLMEVLADEISTIQATTQILKKTVPTVQEHLNTIQNTRLEASINQSQINEIEAVFKRFFPEMDKRADKLIATPKWLLISLVIGFFAFAGSVALNFVQADKLSDMEQTARVWYQKAVDLGYESKQTTE